MIWRWAASLAFLFFVSACTPHFTPKTIQKDQKKLYNMFRRYQPTIDSREAWILSREAILYSKKLSQKYKVSSPPLVHNFLVNVGIKNRGLCYEWSDDLYRHLQGLGFDTLKLKPVGANIGSYWTEHNALVVLPRYSKNMDHGILLDPWRGAGKLYYTPVMQDLDYHWKLRTDRGQIYH